ncbi:MAG: two-component sensor histidine kinase [Xanthomarina sp.]|uniref:histidine kinase n=1 Tax=Xanthomarina gelatinilytica TaxID=1137281 RepID=A0A3C0F8Y3_9FLAO|nr:ATP-binding protein [Xanthomarina sp.]HAB28375.1 two-component sensor histidine kinase [Xanthomarina gelatinilytica]MAL22177.1 two-component sensor histidine kinase [Xanthomarina sp.]MBF61686.1 two-component sensor histidine kinase [Xanthomarina sp.]HAI19880.1 two-component sensor histidine kinase [Xanthomarina gelatinilytica]HCY80658.1 two-component sensor histidine kinase [Xanthomarina gelatinilytica]|tara:strand:+ start:83 stop:1120 length:1038 start_codon:yes stop_codon:yes gene_type:complete
MQKLKKTYKFAIKTALYITVSTTLLLGVFLFATGNLTLLILLFAVVCYFVSFFIIQYRAERFIYRRVKKIYDDLTLLESTSLTKKPITTDMATLTKEIDKYARDKKLEIESLKIREAYRKEFIGNVSHELKTPLFTVQGYLLTLIDGAINDKKIREKYLNRANKGVERLIYIVKDLDMITKFEAGDLRLNITTFDIVELIKSVFDLLEMKASKKKITLTFDIDYNKPILVNADFERIQQVITNLVVNSIKYGREKGTTEISIENLIKNKVIVRITDNGEGIAEANLARVFERFYRVDKSGSRKEGGSGLGLSIVKHIIEAHDEKIYVESELGVGSEFSFSLEKAE